MIHIQKNIGMQMIAKIAKWIYKWEMKLFPIDMEKVYVDQVPNRWKYQHVSFHSSFAPYGIQQIDAEFAKRIMNGNENPKKLKKEIKENPHLHRKIKRNLIFNLNQHD